MIFFLGYLFCGVITGFFAGMFGIGGGVIGIPVLLILFSMQGVSKDIAMHMAIATSLASVVVTTLVSTISFYRKKLIVFSLFKKIVIGSLIGAVIGMTISKNLYSIYLQRIFGIFLILIAIHLWRNRLVAIQKSPSSLQHSLMAFIFGVLSSMLGLGGGVFLVPYFHWCGLSIRNAIATSSACVLIVALVASAGYLMTHIPADEAPIFLPFTMGYVNLLAFFGIAVTSLLFAPLGVETAQKLPAHILKRGFAVFLMVIGCAMLIS